MFKIIKFIILLVGSIVVAGLVLNYFGYEINLNYFKESKAECQKQIDVCAKNLVEQGTKNAKCTLDCADPKLIIKRK